MIPHDMSNQAKGIGDGFSVYQQEPKNVKSKRALPPIKNPSLAQAIKKQQVSSLSPKKRNIEAIKLEKYCASHTLEESYSFIKKKLKRDVIKVFARQIAQNYPGLVHQADRIAHHIYKTLAQGEKRPISSDYDSEKLAQIDRELLKQMERRVLDLEQFHPVTKNALIKFADEQLAQIEKERELTSSQAATTIQRVFRKHRFRKKVKKEESDPKTKARLIEEIKTMMAQGWSIKIHTRPAKPFRKNQLDPQKVEAYLQTQSEERREVLERVLKSSIIKNISFEKFQRSLANSINDFLDYLGSLPEEERGYLIVADQPGKSTNWVVSLCAPQLAHNPPQDVMQNVHLMDHLEPLVRQHQPVRHILMIDDGSYSGEQLARYLKEMVIPSIEKTQRPLTIHLVVPFMTEYAKESILKQQEGEIPIRISEHQMMISMADLPKYLKKLDESDLLQLRKIISEDMAEKHASYAKNIDKPIESRTLTYFEHKLADFASTADWIIEAIIAKTPTIYKSEELGEIMGALESEENQQILADIHQDFRECISLITTDKGSHLYIKGASQGMIDQGIDGEKDYGVVFVTHTDNTTDLMLVGDILKLQEGDVVAFNPYEETATFSKGQFLKNQFEAP